MPHADDTVGVTGEQSAAISRPAKGDAVRAIWLLSAFVFLEVRELRVQVRDNNLGLEVPHLDTGGSSSAQPVTVRGEDQRVDDIASIQRIKALAFVQVPQHSSAVLSTGSAQRSVRGDSDGVKVTGVANEVGLQLAIAQGPYLDQFVPSARNDDRELVGRGKANARNPFGVSFIVDGVLAFTEDVPQLDVAITRTGDNLTVVNREGNRKYILGVSDKTAGGFSEVQVPQAKGTVPRTGKCELAVRRKNNILNEVRVSVEALLRETVRIVFVGKGPHHNGLITGSRDDHVRIFRSGCNGGDPSGVATEVALENKCVSHFRLRCKLNGETE